MENQTFTVSGPSGASPVSTSDTDNTGSRSYTVSGLGTTPVNIALFPASAVSNDEDGIVTFDVTGTAPNEVADGIGETNAVIEVVQGVAVGGDTHVGAGETPITPTNGSITFTVDSQFFDEVVPVVFVDADNDDQLDVAADGTPQEAFGVAGATTYLPGVAAATTTLVDDVVQYVDKDANFFVADGARFNYAEGDTYSYDTNDDGTTNQVITFAQWETALSVGDAVDSGAYSLNFQNSFGIDEDVSGTPTGLMAAVGDFDATADNTDADDARLTWTAPSPANGLIEDYTVTVYDDNPAVAGCQTGTVASAVGSTGTATTVDVEELANDTYCAVVVANTLAGNVSIASAPVFFTVAVTTVDEDAPIITDVTAVRDIGAGTAAAPEANGVLDTGDQVRVQFDEAVVLAANTTLTITDEDGTVAEITRGANATFQLSQNGQTLLITLTGNPLVVDFAANLTVEYPADITDVAGIADATGNVLVVEDENGAPIADQDVTINVPVV